MQIRKVKDAAFENSDFAISFSTNQFIYKIRDRNVAVSRESVTLDEAHGTESDWRPQSLATQ